MSLVRRLGRQSASRPANRVRSIRVIASVAALVVVSTGSITIAPHPVGAVSIATERSKAVALYQQIQTIGSRVETLGQRYDLAQINLQKFNEQIINSKSVVAQIERSLAKGRSQLRRDAIFAYITAGAAAKSNPLFSSDVLKSDAVNVYNRLAAGDVSATLARLKGDKLHLFQRRTILYRQVHRAIAVTREAAKAFREASVLHAALDRALRQVKGQIATFVAQQEAAAVARSAAVLQAARPTSTEVAPPPNSRANIAIRAALGMIGIPYLWGGASRSGVDCSGLILIAYAAAGVALPHYSGSQYAATERVPLWNIQPGDLLFYGPGGSEHEAMYIGNGQMIEAASAGTLVHVSPIRLGYGFIGLGRVR
jgi:cell wall-associated NlpC family hydrolase